MGTLVSTLAFPVPRKELSAHLLIGRGSQLVKLQTKGKYGCPKCNITAIHIQNKTTHQSTSNNNTKPTYTIIYSHGNAEDVGLSLNYLDHLSSELNNQITNLGLYNVNIFAYEYPGYSLSEGEPSEYQCYNAIEIAYEYVTQTLKVPSNQVVLFGRSIGTGPTIDLGYKLYTNQLQLPQQSKGSTSSEDSSQSPSSSLLGGIILQSPLESGIRAVIGYYTSYGLYPLDIFRNYEKISSIECSVFIIHGTKDTVVPCDNGRSLYKQLKEERPKTKSSSHYEPLWINGVGHNDMPENIIISEISKYLHWITTTNNK